MNTSARRFSSLWTGPGDADGPPIIAGGRVWVTSTGNSKLYGLDPRSGAAVVTQPTPHMEHFATPAASDGRLFLATGTTVEAYAIAVAVAPGAAAPAPGSAPTRAGPCPSRLRLRLAVPRHAAVVRARVYRGHARLLDARGRRLRRVTFTAPARTLELQVLETTSRGRHIRFTVRFRACRRVALRRRR